MELNKLAILRVQSEDIRQKPNQTRKVEQKRVPDYYTQ